MYRRLAAARTGQMNMRRFANRANLNLTNPLNDDFVFDKRASYLHAFRIMTGRATVFSRLAPVRFIGGALAVARPRDARLLQVFVAKGENGEIQKIRIAWDWSSHPREELVGEKILFDDDEYLLVDIMYVVNPVRGETVVRSRRTSQSNRRLPESFAQQGSIFVWPGYERSQWLVRFKIRNDTVQQVVLIRE